MEDSTVCPECREQRLGRLPSSSGRAFWVSLFLGAHMLVDAGSGLISLVALGTGGSEALEVAEGHAGLSQETRVHQSRGGALEPPGESPQPGEDPPGPPWPCVARPSRGRRGGFTG